MKKNFLNFVSRNAGFDNGARTALSALSSLNRLRKLGRWVTRTKLSGLQLLFIGAWNLKFQWCLMFGVWSFFSRAGAVFLLLTSLQVALSQNEYQNPVIPGDNPDPS